MKNLVGGVDRVSLHLDARDLEEHAHYEDKCDDDKEKRKRPVHVSRELRLIRILALAVIIISIRHFYNSKNISAPR